MFGQTGLEKGISVLSFLSPSLFFLGTVESMFSLSLVRSLVRSLALYNQYLLTFLHCTMPIYPID